MGTPSAAAAAVRMYNFHPGPATLPLEVLEDVQKEFLSCGSSGMNVMEMSHRGSHFKKILDECTADIRKLFQIAEPSSGGHHILFAHGGASMQFAAVPLNLASASAAVSGKSAVVADYAVTGQWSCKAAEEGQKYCSVSLCVNTKSRKYRVLPHPSTWQLSAAATTTSPPPAYLYYCANETVNGVEYPTAPRVTYESGVKVPLVSDMSSNFASRRIDGLDDHAVIFASLQKNVGPAGTALVLAKHDVVDGARRDCPALLNYKILAEHKSIYNTPSTWNLYVTGKVIRYLISRGGLDYFDELSKKKSQMVYDAIDTSDNFYVNKVDKSCRSRMNIPFEICGSSAPENRSVDMDKRIGDPEVEAEFLKMAAARYHLVGLEGHRSVGGLRASLYNALPLQGVYNLVDALKDFKDEYNSRQ